MDQASPAWNTTCAIWHDPNGPPAPPVTASVACRLEPDPILDHSGSILVWTHRLAGPAGTDRRDAVPGGTPPLIGVPDAAGTLFNVMFVAVANRGTAGEHKVARLRRLAPAWPSEAI